MKRKKNTMEPINCIWKYIQTYKYIMKYIYYIYAIFIHISKYSKIFCTSMCKCLHADISSLILFYFFIFCIFSYLYFYLFIYVHLSTERHKKYIIFVFILYFLFPKQFLAVSVKIPKSLNIFLLLSKKCCQLLKFC